MSTDLASDIGILKRQFRDVHAVVSNIDHRTRKWTEPELHRAGGLVARVATCALLARAQKRLPSDVARQMFAGDRDLAQLLEIRTATGPAMTGSATWAAELAAVVVQDIATNLLPQSALMQLRAASGLDYAFIDGAVARVPVHTPAPSGGFVGEGGAIPVGALILTAYGLKPKKAAGIVAVTKELLAGSPGNVELSLKTLLAQDIGLMIDGILLGSAASSTSAPAGLLYGVTPITATAGGGTNAMMTDVKLLLNAIAPAMKPVLIMNATQSATAGILAPASALPVIGAPYLPAGTVVAVDAAAFASALGVPDFSVDENPTIHMSDVPLPLVGGTAQPPVIGSVAAPTQSLWQTAAVGLRTLIDADWLLRRTGAVAVINGVTW